MTEERPNLLLLAAILIAAAVTQYVPAVADYLLMRWMVMGLGGTVFLSVLIAVQGRRIAPLDRWHSLLLVVYLAHQFEEHGVDLLGRAYAFQAYANGTLADLGLAGNFIFTPEIIFRINLLAVWLPFLVAVWGGRRYLWPGLAAAGLVLVNGIAHIAGGLVWADYNPGLGTAVVLFLPAAILYFRHIQQHCGIGAGGIAGALAFGVGVHALLFLNIRFGVAPDFPAPVIAAVALAPLIANTAYGRLRAAR